LGEHDHADGGAAAAEMKCVIAGIRRLRDEAGVRDFLA
jgi:hypothetical protein